MKSETATPDPAREFSVRRFSRQLRRRALVGDPFVAMIAILLATTLLFIGLWAWVLYGVRRDARLLQLDIAAYRKDRAAKEDAIRAELDTIYRTLYSSPEVATTQPRQPSQVELWQRNRDKELRDRIMRLEQWRLRQER
jgi:hypothetical protein